MKLVTTIDAADDTLADARSVANSLIVVFIFYFLFFDAGSEIVSQWYLLFYFYCPIETAGMFHSNAGPILR